MSSRMMLLVAGALVCCPAVAAAQRDAREDAAQREADAAAGEPLALPDTEVHRLTTPSGRSYSLYVHLPVSYTDSLTKTYPVLYLTDAELEVMAMYAGVSFFLRLTGRIEDVILVGVADGSVAAHGRLRRLDYTPTYQPPESPASGGADEFLSFLREQAMPLVEGRYRADPADRGLWGYSFGGALATHAMLNHTGLFRRYVITSPSLRWDDGLLVRQATEYARTHDALAARVYTAYGADELPAAIEAWREFNATLSAPGYAGFTLATELIPGADHTTVMPVAFMRGMISVYGPMNR